MVYNSEMSWHSCCWYLDIRVYTRVEVRIVLTFSTRNRSTFPILIV